MGVGDDLQNQISTTNRGIRSRGGERWGMDSRQSQHHYSLNSVATSNSKQARITEKRLWQDLWKTKTTPKIRYFMWRALSGALAVKQGLRSRGILLDTTCPRCGLEPETISHVLFHCEAAKEAWKMSGIRPSTFWQKKLGQFSPNSLSC
ncbi:hypothetical protein Bca4012_067293 [Brassica carinata]